MKLNDINFDLFFEKVKFSVFNNCWEWIGRKNKKGYGQFNVGDTTEQAHRVAYIIFNGPIPEGLVIMHSCDNRACVREDHLTASTQLENIKDRDSKSRQARGSRAGIVKLNEEIVAVIKRDLALGMLQRRIAEKHGIDASTVSCIAIGKTWKHVKSADRIEMTVS